MSSAVLAFVWFTINLTDGVDDAEIRVTPRNLTDG
jgi:hypothetical protein